VFDKVSILFHFNIILRHNGMSSAKISSVVLYLSCRASQVYNTSI